MGRAWLPSCNHHYLGVCVALLSWVSSEVLGHPVLYRYGDFGKHGQAMIASITTVSDLGEGISFVIHRSHNHRLELFCFSVT